MRHFQSYLQQSGKEPEHYALIFVNRQGGALRPRGVQKAFKRLLERAEVPKISFHDLRHTAASLLLAQGLPVLEVSRQLGHSRASTPLDVYGHLVPGIRSDAVTKLDQMLTPTAAE